MIYTHVAAFIVGGILAGAAATQVQNWRFDSKEKERLEHEAEIRRNNEKRTTVAAKGLAADQRAIDTKYEVITETVVQIIERPVYKEICLDQDGIDAINGVSK